jgi:hypothetical protein
MMLCNLLQAAGGLSPNILFREASGASAEANTVDPLPDSNL